MSVATAKAKRSTTKITKSSVEALPRPAAGQRSVLWDSEVKGFGVRVTSTGVRTYVLRYQLGGRSGTQRQITIGQHGSPLTADQARKRALELLGLVQGGADPAAEKQRNAEERSSSAERRSLRMFDVVADRWFKRHVQAAALRSEKDIKGVLERDLKPAFAGLSIDEIDKKAVATAFEHIGDRSKSAANKAHKWLRQMFNWLIEKGEIEHSPLDRVKRPFPENKRTRVLTLLELVVVWVACEGLPEPFRSFYRLLILLGKRLRETSNLPWSELDLDGAEWILPAGRAKNKLEHAVPLSEQALSLLLARKGNREVPSGPVLTTDGKVGISGFSKMKDALDTEIRKVLASNPEAAARLGDDLASWVPHDFRRSIGTGCQGMGVPQPVIDATLSHVAETQAGVRGVYQLYDFYDEKAETLARWGALIERAVEAWGRGDIKAILAMDPRRRQRRRVLKTPLKPEA